MLFLMTCLVDECLIWLELRAVKVDEESERLNPLFFFGSLLSTVLTGHAEKA